MRVIVAEDMPMWREVFVKTCRENGHNVVAEARGADETLRLCREHRPDALLLDLRLEEDGDGLNVAGVLRGDSATFMIKIVIITAWTQPFFIQRIAAAPVDGYINKNIDQCRSIAEALVAVANGRRWFPAHFDSARNRLRNDRSSLLSPREQAILGLVGQGLTNEEIGRRLSIAPRTVEVHRHNLLHKLGLKNSPQLVVYAIDNGFATSPLPQN